MSLSTPEVTQLGLQRVYLRLHFRILSLHLGVIRLRLACYVTQFAFRFRLLGHQITNFCLQLRYAVLVVLHENFPFLFWF